MNGIVKRFTERGYGFISGEDGKEYFVHFSSILVDGFKVLYEGEEVNFDAGDSPKGLLALNVQIVHERQKRTFKDDIIAKGEDTAC